MYTFTGKIIKVSPVIKCTGKVKEKCTFVVRDDTQDREVAFVLFDDAIDRILTPLEIGDVVTVYFTIKSREYQGSYTTNCYASDVTKVSDGGSSRSSRDRYKKRDDEGKSWDNAGSPFGSTGWKERMRQEYERQKKEREEEQRKQQQQNRSSSSSTNYFAGVYNKEDAKKKYRQLCKDNHPDMPGGSTEKMQEINKQYERWR